MMLTDTNEMIFETWELLHTKLLAPYRRIPTVARPDLLARLDEGLSYRLILLSAPAGFGKTTLAGDWLAARTGQMPSAWVTLDDGDNDPVRFWNYVFTACQVWDEAAGQAALAQLNAWQQPLVQAILTRWINELARAGASGVLVLDDFHRIASPQVQAGVAFLLDHLPHGLHLVVLTRSAGELPLARLRARSLVCELGPADLRFSEAETRAFFEQAAPGSLPPGALARLAARTEGWPAGLRLVALALKGRTGPEERQRFLDSFSGSHQPVLEYLVHDVLEAQPAPVQEFLLETSLLGCLTGSLCDAVTGRSGGEACLAELAAANLFLVPLDGQQQWYRYHILFGEAMQHEARRRLGMERIQALYGRASQWYEAQGRLAEAVPAALQAGTFERAAGLIERLIAPRLPQNEYHTLRAWLEALPEPVLEAHPRLSFHLAVAQLFTSDRRDPAVLERLQAPLRRAESAWRASQDWPHLGQALAIRSIVAWGQGDFPAAFASAAEGLTRLPPGDQQWRGICLIFQGAQEAYNGDLNAAWKTLLQAQALSERAGNIYGVLSATHLLGEVCAGRGDLAEAARLFQASLQGTFGIENTPFEPGRVWLGLAQVALEQDDLEAAERQAGRALETGRQIQDRFLQLRASLLLAQVAFARRSVAQAQEHLHRLVTQAPQGARPFLMSEIQAYQAWMALVTGDLVQARLWRPVPGAAEGRSPQEREALVLAGLALADGRVEQALTLLGQRRAQAQAGGRLRSEIEILILTALARAAAGDRPAARQDVFQALRLAQPGGFRRVFLDYGEPLLHLLRDCGRVIEKSNHPRLQAFYQELLGAFERERRQAGRASAAGFLKPAAGPLIDPLSLQEERVLGLLAAGLTYQEIARELVISVNTVKTHVKGIYRKLNLSRRSQARQAAQELNISL